MSTAGSTTVTAVERGSAHEVGVLKGLLWQEWLAHRGQLSAFLVCWLVCVWVLLIFYHPAWILAFGLIYALVVGPAVGGSDVMQGAEEFAFALPPTRAQRYLVRLALTAGPLLVLTGIGLLAIGFDLPQKLWGLVVNSGFTEPFPTCRTAFLYPLALVLPAAALAFCFAIAATTESRGVCSMAWLFGGIGAAAVMGCGFFCEQLLWSHLNGVISCPALAAAAVMAALAGYLRYARKEGISRPTAVVGRRLWMIVLAVLILLFLLFILSLRLWTARSYTAQPVTTTRSSRAMVPGDVKDPDVRE